MKAHYFLQDSPVSNEAGFVEVDKDYLQSTKHENVFTHGDCSKLPTTKTAADVGSVKFRQQITLYDVCITFLRFLQVFLEACLCAVKQDMLSVGLRWAEKMNQIYMSFA